MELENSIITQWKRGTTRQIDQEQTIEAEIGHKYMTKYESRRGTDYMYDL
jgi:hypothetical protein